MRPALVLLLAVVLVIPLSGQQQPPVPDRVKEAKILETGHQKGTIAAAPNIGEFYYHEKPESEWIPDEFMSNPDRKIDLRTLPGYHLPPQILEMELLTSKKVKVGDEVKVRVLTRSKTPVDPNAIIYEGPDGRDIRFSLRMAKAIKSESKDGMLYETWEGAGRIGQWLPGGTYFPVAVQNVSDQLGHGKSYRSDFHPAMDRETLSFELEHNPNYDVTAPKMHKFVLGSLTGSPVSKPYQVGIREFIPVYAEITDEKSGVNEVVVTIMSPKRGLYGDLTLVPSLEKENAYVGYFRLNPWYEGGEYKISRVRMVDKAANELTVFPQSNPVLEGQTVIVAAEKEDLEAPKLITLDIDKRQAKAGDQVKLTAIIVDNLSGVDNITVTIHSPSSIDKRRVVLRPKSKPPVMIKPAYDVQENVYEGTFNIHPLDETGWWTVKRVVARDLANNYLDMVSTDYPLIEKIQVKFAPGDNVTGDFGPTGYTREGAPAQPGKIRRVDMIPPHPPRGACLNCHEPQR